MSEPSFEGIGAKLAAAREAQGLSLVEVADKLKLSARQIEALEAEDFSRLPGTVFVRGFVRNYARLLGLDPDGLLAALEGPRQATETITAPSEGVSLGRSPVRRWLLLPMLVLLVFLALVGGLYAWLSQGEEALVTSAPVAGSGPGATGEASPAVTPVPAPAVPAPLPPTAPGATLPAPDNLSATSGGAPVGAPGSDFSTAAMAVPQTPPLTPAASQPPAVSSRASLRFLAQEDSWVQVVDADGQRYSKLVRAGMAESFEGSPPFRLVVGNAARVAMEFNGRLLDLKPFIGEKVAKLTLDGHGVGVKSAVAPTPVPGGR